MRAINNAYRLLTDPKQRAAYDARRYLRSVPSVGVAHRAGQVRRTVSVQPPPSASPPTELQRRVDRIVAIVGVILLVLIGFYVVNVIPYAERQFEAERRNLLGQGDGTIRAQSRSDAPLSTDAGTRASGEHVIGAPVPGRLTSDDGLRHFPGAVLVAPSSLSPFSSLPITHIDANGVGIARYAVYYGDLTSGGATISGLVGRTAFDAAAPHMPDCAPEAAYCAGPAPGQPTSSGAAPGYELFRAADLVGDNPAFATHRVCCNGVFWSLSWYEAKTNMSYSIDLSRSIAAHYGAATALADTAAARAVAGLAPQLVRLS